MERRTEAMRPSAIVLALGGVLVMALGGYVALRRTPLSAADLRYLDRSFAELQGVAPSLNEWLRGVFYVLGGFMVATGIVTLYIAVTAFRRRARGVAVIVGLAGGASVGGMALVELLIDRWAPVTVALVWLLAFALYQLEGLSPSFQLHHADRDLIKIEEHREPADGRNLHARDDDACARLDGVAQRAIEVRDTEVRVES
jgi:hypothetical protein